MIVDRRIVDRRIVGSLTVDTSDRESEPVVYRQGDELAQEISRRGLADLKPVDIRCSLSFPSRPTPINRPNDRCNGSLPNVSLEDARTSAFEKWMLTLHSVIDEGTGERR